MSAPLAIIASCCWRDEVDLLIKSGNQLIPIEIKSSKTYHSEFLKGLRYFKEIAGDRFTKGYLIYAGDREQRIKDFFVAQFTHIKKISETIDSSVSSC